jgi:hypothetical protein
MERADKVVNRRAEARRESPVVAASVVPPARREDRQLEAILAAAELAAARPEPPPMAEVEARWAEGAERQRMRAHAMPAPHILSAAATAPAWRRRNSAASRTGGRPVACLRARPSAPPRGTKFIVTTTPTVAAWARFAAPWTSMARAFRIADCCRTVRAKRKRSSCATPWIRQLARRPIHVDRTDCPRSTITLTVTELS